MFRAAALNCQLREHYHLRDGLGCIADGRRSFLDSLMRGGEEEAKQAETQCEQAEAKHRKGLPGDGGSGGAQATTHRRRGGGTVAAVEEAGEVVPPDRLANQPDKLETFHKLTAATNRAKDVGDINTLRPVAADPPGFILRSWWGRSSPSYGASRIRRSREAGRRFKSRAPTPERLQPQFSRWLLVLQACWNFHFRALPAGWWRFRSLSGWREKPAC